MKNIIITVIKMHSSEFEEFFYKRLTQLRLEKNVSARDMSLSMGQNENYINLIENRSNLPSLMGLFYICEYFGIHPKEFFDDGAETPVEMHMVFQKLKRLEPKKYEHIMQLVDDLL